MSVFPPKWMNILNNGHFSKSGHQKAQKSKEFSCNNFVNYLLLFTINGSFSNYVHVMHFKI